MIGAATMNATATSLHPEHLADLQKSGLTDATIRAAGLYSVRPSDLAKLVGFNPVGVQSALCFPYQENGHCRVKVFPSFKDRNGHTVKYLQRRGSDVQLYITCAAQAVMGDPSVPLAVTEGEKKALALTQAGRPCIGLGGLWSWMREGKPISGLDAIAWAGRTVTLYPDSDVWKRPDLMQAVYALMRELAARGAAVTVAIIPGDDGGKQGIDDFLVERSRRGVSPPEALSCLATLPLDHPAFADAAAWWEQWRGNGRGEAGDVDGKPAETPWPVLDAAALQGLAGEIVRAIDPFTEADPVAVLVQLLAFVGCAIGREPHFTVEHTPHPVKLFAALVGATAKGRKGQSTSSVKHIFKQAFPDFVSGRIKGGLSSGEGLIWQVRDPIYEKQRDRKTGQEQEVMVDEGEADKRLIVLEPELAQVLKVMCREGNILSPIIRQAWDDEALTPLTKNNRMTATGSHICIVGHITKDELLRHLGETEMANGFANRFIFLAVKRSKYLPNPKGLPVARIEQYAKQLVEQIERARRTAEQGPVERDEEAEALWCAVYPDLSEGKPGLVGAILGRAEAQVMRLALAYALLDGAACIGIQHLQAALALWDYSEASVRFIFGTATGDGIANRILEALTTQGEMTETEISYDLFQRNVRAGRIHRALETLRRSRLIEGVIEETGGRKKTAWRVTIKTIKTI